MQFQSSFGIVGRNQADHLSALEPQTLGILNIHDDEIDRLQADIAPVVGDGPGMAAEGILVSDELERVFAGASQWLAGGIIGH